MQYIRARGRSFHAVDLSAASRGTIEIDKIWR